MVPAPKRDKGMNAQEVVLLIADLKKSEMSKSRCGKRLIKFYEGQR